MKYATVAILALCLAACGDDAPAAPLLGDVVRLDDASEEVLEGIADEVDRSGTTVDAARSSAITAPASGAALPGATPATFTWTLPTAGRKTPRHGITTGTFTWIRFEGAGMAKSLEVLSLTSTSYTPDAATWAKLQAATGAITTSIVTTVCDRGVIVEGPFAPGGADVSFTISP